ncbi:MAG: hypothetical protein ACJA0Q_001640, partial [Saprospiraceae bacterium]
MNFQKYKLAYLCFILTLMVSGALYTNKKYSLELLTHENVYSSSYTDEDLEGNSKCFLNNKQELNFEYTLGDQYQYAFTGISIDVYSDDDEVETKENIVLDLSDFESMEFQ